MGAFVIEKGVPLPEPDLRGRGHGGPRKYPWHEMEVGDSFHVEGVPYTTLSGPIHNAKIATGFDFTRRSTPTGVRVWRIA